MSIFRAILVTLVALSVVLLPIAGGMVVAKSPAATLLATQADCCAPGEPCGKKGAGDCGTASGCVLKCFNFSAVVAGPAALTSPAPTSEKLALITQSLPSASENPPLPPPRV